MGQQYPFGLGDNRHDKNVQYLGMGELLGICIWVNWIPKGVCHLHGLETYPYSNNGALEGGLELQCLLFGNPYLLGPNGQCPGEGLTQV